MVLMKNLFPASLNGSAQNITGGSSAPEFRRVYAIGDIHGRLDLFRRLIADVAIDNRLRDPMVTGIVLLGDVIDRGPQSAQLLRACRELTRMTDRFVMLKGNHEAMMVTALRHDLRAMGPWLRYGGRETLHSFGMTDAEIDDPEPFDLAADARSRIGEDLLDWVDSLPVTLRAMDYLFVHAGIRPGIPLKEQEEDDLLWIRDEFLNWDEDFGGLVVVHGHTVFEGKPGITDHRIGIDTGAYYTGQLTAVGLERGEGWIFSTSDPEQPRGQSDDYDPVAELAQANQG
jgi:serine/threonine protein phosphatase 1